MQEKQKVHLLSLCSIRIPHSTLKQIREKIMKKKKKKTELENESVKCQQASMLLYMDFLFLMLGFFQSHFPAGIRDEKTVF